MHADLIARIEQHIRKLDAYQWGGAADVDPLPILTKCLAAVLELGAEVERLLSLCNQTSEDFIRVCAKRDDASSRAEAAEAKLAEIREIVADKTDTAWLTRLNRIADLSQPEGGKEHG